MAGSFDAGFTAPNIGPGAAFIASVLNQNRSNDRADEYLSMEKEAIARSAERESAALKRQEEDDKRKHAIEAWNALPMLQRAAAKSVGMANMNPYGVKFDEQQAAPSLRDSGINVMGGNDQYANHAAQVLLGQTPQAEEPRTIDPTMGQHSGAPSQAAQYGTPSEEAGEPAQHNEVAEGESPGIEAAQALLAQPHSRKLFATMNGQRFEVPEQSDKTAFGPEYDSIYANLIDQGINSKDAMKLVAAQYKTDQVQKRIGERSEAQIKEKNFNREDQQSFTEAENEKYRRTFEQAKELANIGANSRIAAAAPGLKADAANARDMSVLRQQGAAIRSTAQFNKLAAADKTVRGLMVNIASGTVPLQHADAQIQLARFFRQAQPTEGEMHMLYNNLGGTADKWNQFVARLSKGDLSAEQMRQLRASAKTVAKEHQEDINRFANISRHMLGPGSGFENMPDQAQALYEGMGSELGLENLPALYGTEGGVSLGSGKRPTTQPRGTKKTALDELESQLDAMGAK